MQCIIDRATLRLGSIAVDEIVSIRIAHHWSYDELYVELTDGTGSIITCENGKIQVNDNGSISTYALCKLNYIEFGKRSFNKRENSRLR